MKPIGTLMEKHLIRFTPYVLTLFVFFMLSGLGVEAHKVTRAMDLLRSGEVPGGLDAALNILQKFAYLASFAVLGLGIAFFLMVFYQFVLKARYDRLIKILRHGHSRYKFLAEGPLSIGIMRIDCNSGRVIDANTGALRLFGYSRAEFIGKDLSQFLEEPSVHFLEKALKKIREGKKFFEFSCTIKTALDETRDIDFHIAVPGGVLEYLEEGASNSEVVAILTDVTERRMAEAERLKNERLRGVLEMAGGAAHELNQPLQVVLGYAAMISMQMEDDHPLKEKVEKLKEEAERLTEIGKKIASISDYAVRDYVGNVKIVDIHQASKGNDRPDGRGQERAPGLHFARK